MAKVRYTIRFYTMHDLDLITFTLTHDFDIVKAIYSSVTAFAKGEAFIISVPPLVRDDMPEKQRVFVKALVLDSDKDHEAIEMIDRITPGRRNNFFKNLLRLYLLYPFSEYFVDDPADLGFFESKLAAFRNGREVRAGKTNRTTHAFDGVKGKARRNASGSGDGHIDTGNTKKAQDVSLKIQKENVVLIDVINDDPREDHISVESIPEKVSRENIGDDKRDVPTDDSDDNIDEDMIMALFNSF